MQVIVKEKENGIRCLFDTRSEQFFPGGCCSENFEADMLEVANWVVTRRPKTIVEIADFQEYTDNGYTEWMLANDYLDINPDIRDKVMERLKIDKTNLSASVDRRTVRYGKGKGKRGRPKGSGKPKPEKVPVMVEVNGVLVKRGRGRPKKNAVVVPVAV